MYKNCHISASMAPRHLKIGRERAYTTIYHKMDLFLRKSNYFGNNMAKNRKKCHSKLLDHIYPSSMQYTTGSLNTIFLHMPRLGSL